MRKLPIGIQTSLHRVRQKKPHPPTKVTDVTSSKSAWNLPKNRISQDGYVNNKTITTTAEWTYTLYTSSLMPPAPLPAWQLRHPAVLELRQYRDKPCLPEGTADPRICDLPRGHRSPRLAYHQKMATRRMGYRLVSRHPDRLLANPAVHILTDPAVQRTVCHPAADPAARNSFPPLHPGLRRSMPDLERPPRLCLLGMEVTGHESAFPDPHALSACLHHPVRHLCKTIPARTTYLPLPLGRSEDRRQVAQTQDR